MQTSTLRVPTVHCRSCTRTIEDALGEIDGVTRSVVNLDTLTLTVTFDPEVVGLVAIANAVVGAGYPASVDA